MEQSQSITNFFWLDLIFVNCTDNKFYSTLLELLKNYQLLFRRKMAKRKSAQRRNKKFKAADPFARGKSQKNLGQVI